MTEKELRQKVADTINAWVGGTKGSAKHLNILAVYNSHKPLARGYTVKPTDAYCATTVSAAFIRAGIAEYTGTECGVECFVKLAQQKGIWVEDDAHIPKVGDACVYDWDDNGKGDDTGAGDHIGVVTAAGNPFTVTEGNMSSGKIGKRRMAVNGKYIRGFICPDYAAIAKKLEGDTATASTVAATITSHTVAAGDTLAKIAAKYGTTVASLVKINGITNPNVIHVGQVIALTSAAAACIKLASVGVINSPDYWASAAATGKVKYLEPLLTKAAEKITKAGTRTATPVDGVAALVAAGIINTPDYWLVNYGTFPSLGALLCALGGAVK